VPVIPCRLEGCHAALPSGAAVPRRGRIGLHVGPPLRFDALGNNREGWEATARALQEVVRCPAKSRLRHGRPDRVVDQTGPSAYQRSGATRNLLHRW
jgi:1-acyl-sn-glycerol-3-phosphate acyltransferase